MQVRTHPISSFILLHSSFLFSNFCDYVRVLFSIDYSLSIDVNITYDKFKEKANVRDYHDLVGIIHQLFDKILFTDFNVVVD